MFQLQACDDDNNGPTGPDFSYIPAPVDLSTADTTYTQDRVEVYVTEEGICPNGEKGFCSVTPRDQIFVKYTGRIFDDQTLIFENTYADSTDRSALITNLPQGGTQQQAAQIEGFRCGLPGMKEGEKRVIIVSPAPGYDDSRPGVNGIDLREKELRYDVELTNIQ